MKELVIDISHWDDGIDLAAWKSRRGCWGVIVKAGGNEGGRYEDSTFERNYDKAIAAGLHVGAYYYTTVTSAEEAREDARHCLSIIGSRGFDLPIYIDVEDAGQTVIGKRRLTDVCLAFIREVESAGHRGGVYTSGSWWLNNVYADELRPYANWIAWWTGERPSAISDVGMWQQGGMRLSDGNVVYDDVSGYVDCNWCYIDYPSKKGGAKVSTLRERVVAAVRSQIGQPYYSMNYGASDGWNGEVGTHYVGRGWGCAQLDSYPYNTILGTRFTGSVWNFAGDALGQSPNQGGGEFEFTDNPQPGDVCLYKCRGYDGRDATDYGHVGIYVGNGMVVSALGQGTPGSSGYVNIGVKEHTAQHAVDISGGNLSSYRYLRCKRLDKGADVPKQVPGNRVNNAGLSYQAHSQDLGWNEKVYDGQTAGTTGFGLRMEALRFVDIPEGWTLYACAHIQNEGWKRYDGIRNGSNVVIGTTGKSQAIECLILGVSARPAGDNRRLKFRVHQQDAGWKGWTPEGFASGTDGMSMRLEAVQVMIQ